MTVDQPLNFGTVFSTAASSMVTVTIANTITMSGAATAPGGGNFTVGTFTFEGQNLTTTPENVTINMPTAPQALTGPGGTIFIYNMTGSTGTVSSTQTTTQLFVGGAVDFDATTAPGTYTGNVQVQGTGSAGSGTATVNLPISITIFSPLSASQVTPLSFGDVSSTGGATITMSSAGTRSITSGTATLDPSAPGTNAVFNITGQQNTAVTVTLPTSTTLTGPGAAMTVNNFTSNPATGSTTLDSSGNLTLNVGADLIINSGQVPGSYTGTYTITISY